jgi:hypothetical protein
MSSEWHLVGFSRSSRPNKKVVATLKNENTGRTRSVHFGQRGSVTYKDKTGKGGDSTHGDPKKRENYRKRHQKPGPKFSPSYFSWFYLW